MTTHTDYLNTVFKESFLRLEAFMTLVSVKKGLLNCHNCARRLFPFLDLGRQQETQELLTLGRLKEMISGVEVNRHLASGGSNPV